MVKTFVQWLFCIVSKMFEKNSFRTIAHTFLNFVIKFQNCFLPRKTVVIQLNTNLSRIYRNLNIADHVNLLNLFDFSEAFDETKHNIVLDKLIQLGVSEKLFYLLEDYLTSRTLSVKINTLFQTRGPSRRVCLKVQIWDTSFFDLHK